MNRTALVLSPHLDDAVFSCGGVMAQLADAGWRVVMATVFTRSVHPAAGFALNCQLDKGLAADVDYMALRRAEDLEAAVVLGVEARWLDLPEAPHRGYGSAAALFGPLHPEDGAWQDVAALLDGLLPTVRPALVLAPQGLGDHVDHRQTIRAVAQATVRCALAFYRDTPYAIRNGAAVPGVARGEMVETAVDVAAGLARKVAASCRYASQIGFQFGGAEQAARALREFAVREGGGVPAERFLGGEDGLSLLHG